MKHVLGLIAVLIFAPGAHAQLLVEHFLYNDGSLGASGVGSAVWTAGDSPSTSIQVSSAAALTNSQLDGIAGKGVVMSGGTFKKRAAPFTAQNSGSVYVSFLMRVQTAGSGAKAIVYLNDTTSATSSPELGVFLDGNSIGIGKNASTPVTSTTLSAGTHLIVAAYTFLAGADRVDLWVDPTSLGSTTNVPSATLTTTSGSDGTSLAALFLNHAVNQTIYVDEIRLGTSWADVTPTTGAPPPPLPPSFSVTEAFFDPAGFVLRGVGGSPTSTYFVVASTDPSASMSTWPAIATNQFDLAGNFDCTNSVSPLEAQQYFSVRSIGALPPPPVGPTITNQPQGVTVTEGNSASFAVGASGTAPLLYQWYFNTNVLLTGGTNSTLLLSNVSFNDAGDYSVVISNSVGTAASSFATLTVNPANTNLDFGPIGFCNSGGTITGGAAGPTVYVGSETQLRAYSDVNGPYTIYVTNSFNLTGMGTHVRANKTIIGLGPNIVLTGGGLYMHGGGGGTNTYNIIIRNLTIRNSTDDNIGITSGSNRIWIDHCTFMDASDGCMDFVKGADSLTVSWCKFVYTSPALSHRLACLISSSDSDAGVDMGKLRATFHHNWFADNCDQRMPSVRFGRVHAFNNYFNTPGNLYAIRARLFSECRIENNFFDSVGNPWEVYLTPAGGDTGKVWAADNTLVNCTFTPYSDTKEGLYSLIVPGTNTVFAPPYTYNLDPAADIPDTVINNAGAGKGPFAP